MANLYYARKIEKIYFEALKKSENKQKEQNNSIHLVCDNTQLKPIDLVNEAYTISDKTFESSKPGENLTEELVIQKPDMTTKADSIRIGNAILDEVCKFWTSKDKIRKKINEINTKNVFNFIGYMISISESGTAIGELQKYSTCSDIKHLVFCLLKQAKNSGLVNLKQYLELKSAYSTITTICNINPAKKLDKNTFFTINTAIEEMYEELFKIY